MQCASRPQRSGFQWVAFFIGFVLVFTVGTAVWASGGYGGGGYGGGYQQQPRPQANPQYELGKAVYAGRAKSNRGVKICLAPEASADQDGDVSEPRRLSRRNLKVFRKSTTDALSSSLVNCELGSETASEALDRRELSALVYYLNQRYALKLDR